MENRNGLVVDVDVTHANGTAERAAAKAMIDRSTPKKGRKTLGADVSQKQRSAIDGRTTRHDGYAASQKVRKGGEDNGILSALEVLELL